MIALGALGYKIACTVYYWDSISMWWARTIAMFFVLYITSLDDSSLVEYGIFPLVNLLNTIAGVFDLIGFFRLKKRASSQILGEYAQPTL